ncbi:MAG: hypothetical protein AAF764_09005 [Pseudomonadota bacterium]
MSKLLYVLPALILAGCVDGTPNASVQGTSKTSNAFVDQAVRRAKTDRNRTIQHTRVYAKADTAFWWGSQRKRRQNETRSMKVLIEYDRSNGFPIYRFAFQPETFPVSDLAALGSHVRVKFGRLFKEDELVAPMPASLSAGATGTVYTPWVFCPVCFNSKIDDTKEGLRLASEQKRKVGFIKTGPMPRWSRGGTSVYGRRDPPSSLVAGPGAASAARAYGAKLDGFAESRSEAKPANDAYLAFAKTYRDSLPQAQMKRGRCKTDASGSVGDIKSFRRAARAHGRAASCRQQVLARFDRTSYRRSLPGLKREEARLYSATSGVRRTSILTTEEVIAESEKLVARSQGLARGYRADTDTQRGKNRKARERARRERAVRNEIFRSAAQTNRRRQQQQRDVGTQQVDPTTGRVTTASQRAAQAKRAGEAARRNTKGTSAGISITLTEQKKPKPLPPPKAEQRSRCEANYTWYRNVGCMKPADYAELQERRRRNAENRAKCSSCR